MQSLVFFDKEGNPLNFYYNQSVGRYEGDILFPENSDDTFKTQALYLFEKIDAFEYENVDYLTLKKFQLFNEYGFHFYPGVASQSVTKIEPVNQESAYYSKWIYSKNIESKYKKGTFVKFNSPIFEFTNPNRIYAVVGSKKDAICVLSLLDNNTFETNYGGLYGLTSSYDNIYVEGVDIIGIYNYITPDLRDTLSLWNEPSFYDRLYQYRRLNLVNTEKNDNYRRTKKYDDVEVVTIENPNILDIVHFEYNCSSIPENTTLWMEVITRTDLPRVYKAGLSFSTSGSVLNFDNPVPRILKPGVEFKVPNSSLNLDFYKVTSIPIFTGNNTLTYYATGSQVIWDNKIYQCIQAYTWSGATYSVQPTGTTTSELYWGNATYLPIEPSSSSGAIVNESLVGGEIYLTTDHLYFSQSFTQSVEVTLASTVEKFNQELKILDIDLYYKDYALRADLIYPTNYAVVNFYHTEIGPTYSVGGLKSVYERCIQVEERLTKEFNYNYSENWNYNIVFTDIDEFGIIIKINKMVYGERIDWIYSSGLVDMERTIDSTLRNWLTRHFLSLNTLGILPSLTTVGYASVYYNTITLQTDFPNVPIEFSVQVGTTADYYIEHSIVTFFDLGKNLSIKINGRTYEELVVYSGSTPDIAQTLENWVENWSETVNDFGIYVSNAASSLKFNVKKQSQRVSLDINVGKSSLPGIQNYRIIERATGNLGALITSNEILLGTASGESLEEVGFATGQVIGINKTFYPLQNIEYNSLYLNPDTINLSYEGPFWGLTDSLCSSAPFTTVAFTIGWGQTGCPPSFSPSLLRGMYDEQAYNTSFSIEYIFSNTYNSNTFEGVANMVDISYVEPANCIYVLGDSLRVFDSTLANVISDIDISGLTASRELCYNNVSSYIYALSENALYKIDPFIHQVVASFSFASTAYSIQLNKKNGDIYVSFNAASQLYVYDINDSLTVITTPFATLGMVFNDFEEDMYVNTNAVGLLRIDGTTRTISNQYFIYGNDNPIAYDPENEAVYTFYEGTNLYKVDNNTATSIPLISTGTFNSLLFNNLTSTINSSSNLGYNSLLLSDATIEFSVSPSDYGYQALNQYDGDIYIGGTSQILTIDATNGQTKNVQSYPGGAVTKLIYNPDRRSIWSIQPDTNLVIEIQVVLSSYFELETTVATPSNDTFYGTLSPDYKDRDYLWLSVREYIRRPRENFNDEPIVSLYWRWFSDNVPEFFLYDFSGTQLPTTGVLAYTGEKPLPNPVLNKSANRDIKKISDPSVQQTIFDSIEHDLEYVDDNEDISVVPEPIQLFIGYNSKNEGGLRSILQLYKREDIDFTITTTNSNYDIITIETIVDRISGDVYGKISLDTNSTSFFTSNSSGVTRGFKRGQHLAIFIKDVTNSKRQYVSINSGYLVKIREVYTRELIVDFFKSVDRFQTEKTVISNYPKTGNTTYLSVRFKVWDREIGRFNILGQTEIEDVRYHTELNNVGKLVSSDDVYIFKEYDIKEEGIDWNYLNAKRKEMLLVKHLIYPYIGAYKSIINAINYFGYNDLELYEYYRNIDDESENFGKLFKVEIPDIFDNTVEGWKDNDFIKHTFPNPKFEDTNLFNLTFRITDKEGNNVLYYTLEEVQKKLQGLKYWLQKNIIPITHKILDITGRADFVGGTTLVHLTRDAQIFRINENYTPILFDLNEAYLLPVNSGSTVYNCVLDFYINEQVSKTLLPQYFTIDIKTYEIYREWYAFRTYQIGERVVYYDKLYESVVSNNRTNNPRKFENAEVWQVNTAYKLTDVVSYDRLIYIWTGQAGATFSTISPVLDEGVGSNWLNITEWKLIDLVPVEKITEYRDLSGVNGLRNLMPFNFTVDSNITPYLVIEVTSDNGYGLTYRDRKNFEIKGILDIQEIEAFANLTTKQYRDATTPVVYADISTVPDLSMSAGAFAVVSSDLSGNPTNRPYSDLSGNVVYPSIQHEFPYTITNNSSFTVNQFKIEFSGDFAFLNNPYVVSTQGSAYVTGLDMYWNGSLAPAQSVTVRVRANVTSGGKAYWVDNPNTANNQSYVPVEDPSFAYNVVSKLASGTNYGVTFSTSANLTVSYRILYYRQVAIGALVNPTDPIPGQFQIFTFSQQGINIIGLSDSVIYGTNYATVADGFNNVLGDFGYAYYQSRTSGANFRPTFLVATWYTPSLFNSSVYYTGPTPTLAGFSVGNPNFNADFASTLQFGTNSTSGGWTIANYYYP